VVNGLCQPKFSPYQSADSVASTNMSDTETPGLHTGFGDFVKNKDEEYDVEELNLSFRNLFIL
jgi:hypothetical protein